MGNSDGSCPYLLSYRLGHNKGRTLVVRPVYGMRGAVARSRVYYRLLQ